MMYIFVFIQVDSISMNRRCLIGPDQLFLLRWWIVVGWIVCMTRGFCWMWIGGVLYLRWFERTNFVIGGSGRASLFHLLFRLVYLVCVGSGVRVVRKRDWFVVLEMVSRLAGLLMGLVCELGTRCFWSRVFCRILCKVVLFLRF
jgi:hypothetical protein